MIGILIKLNDRPDIIFENGTFYGGLHCGECLSIFEKKYRVGPSSAGIH